MPTPAAEEELNPDRLPPRLFATNRYPDKGRINSYSRPDYLLDIVEAFEGTKEFEWLMASRFGRLFQLPVRKSSLSGKLVHQFLCRSLVTGKRNEIWFVFGGHPIRFSLREFGIITGLNCGPFPAKTQTPEGKEKYYNTIIGPKNSCTIQEIVDMLKRDKRLPKSKRMDGERRLKLALIVIVEGILVCNSSTVRASHKVAEMVKDVEAFVRYPWGRKSFKRTLEMVTVGKHVATVEKLANKLNNNSHIATHGFPLAFQLLILHAVPLLERYLPDANDEATFTDRSVLHMTLLKTFHNSNILETEMDSNLEVESILHTEDPMDIQDYSFAGEVEDAEVDYLFNKLKDGHIFKKEDWHGGLEDMPLITPGLSMKQKPRKPPARKPTQQKKEKGKKTNEKEDNVGAEASGEASDIHLEHATAEDLLREVDRRNNEHQAKLEQMMSLGRSVLRDEIVYDVLTTLRQVGVLDSVNLSHSELLAEINKSRRSTVGSSGREDIPKTNANNLPQQVCHSPLLTMHRQFTNPPYTQHY